jgi:hypothetical protein
MKPGGVMKMSATPIKQEIVEELDKLTPELQLQVLTFVRKLRLSSAEGVPGKELLRFAGILTPEEAELMERAIEEGCERVDQGDW